MEHSLLGSDMRSDAYQTPYPTLQTEVVHLAVEGCVVHSALKDITQDERAALTRPTTHEVEGDVE